MYSTELHVVRKNNVVRGYVSSATPQSRRRDAPLRRRFLVKQWTRTEPVICCVARDNSFRDNYQPPKTDRFILDANDDDRQVVIETGAIGRQTNGAVLAKHGNTVIYVTACCASGVSGADFMPLTVDYVEKLSSIGQTAKGYIKRDRQKDSEVLTSRIVDRSIRPLFPDGWRKETQILETVMSYDGVNPTEPLAITAAGAALALSDIPFVKCVVGVRMGWIDGPVINPTMEQQERSKIDLILAGTTDGIVMIEANGQFIEEADLLKALRMGVDYVISSAGKLEAWCRNIQKEKMTDGVVTLPLELHEAIYDFARNRLTEIFSKTLKQDRNIDRAELWNDIVEKFVTTSETNDDDNRWKQTLRCESTILKERLLESGIRIDGRTASDIRPIYSSANVLPTTHGSALFTRGYTQAICVATLGLRSLPPRLVAETVFLSGSQKAALKVNTLQEEDIQRFYLQYFFPPSSVGEVRRFNLYPNRRELGHGQLASWAIAPAVPKFDDFPYTIRVESTITESDGSSSMASVCGGYLAMMDAGVPLTHPIAGIAMGLVMDETTGTFIILSDILGTEDALGDMDFKVAGTADGVSAVQMDVKVGSISFDILSSALEQAKKGRREILAEMTKCDPPVRRDLSPDAPHIKIITINSEHNGKVIGPGGKHIRFIEEEAGVERVTVDESGEIEIIGHAHETVLAAEILVRRAAGQINVGDVIKNAVVSAVREFGAFVDIAPGRTGLMHVSQVSSKPVIDITDTIKVGDKIEVEVTACHSNGKYSLSRKSLLKKQQETLQARRPIPPSPDEVVEEETTASA